MQFTDESEGKMDVKGLELGAELIPLRNIESRVLVCFLDGEGGLHFGFAYKNGNTVRAVCHEYGERVNKTIPLVRPILVFSEATTAKRFKGNFSTADFQFLWFDKINHDYARALLQEEEYEDMLSRFDNFGI